VTVLIANVRGFNNASAVVLYRVDPSRNMRRFYRLDVQPDLFGLWLLIREWGRIGRPGRTRIVSFATIDAAQEALQRLRQVKERRGYAALRPAAEERETPYRGSC
jgi:predicted DNA-binding WGR domain protein